jgi:hypothetical protein
VRTPEGETWTLRDVDWMTLRLAATGDEANVELTGVLLRPEDGDPVTLHTENPHG